MLKKKVIKQKTAHCVGENRREKKLIGKWVKMQYKRTKKHWREEIAKRTIRQILKSLQREKQ